MRILLLLLIYSYTVITSWESPEVKTWKIGSGSVIEIAGSTNISRFHCESSKYQGDDILKETYFPDSGITRWSGLISLNTSDFDCFNAMMTRDFRETLQVDDHPAISVRFINLIMESENINQENLKGEVEITLAGVSRIYPISCVFLAENNGKALLAGNRKLTFTDFEIVPPVKLMGTIQVRDSIEVNFGLVLEEEI